MLEVFKQNWECFEKIYKLQMLIKNVRKVKNRGRLRSGCRKIKVNVESFR